MILDKNRLYILYNINTVEIDQFGLLDESNSII